MPKELKPLTINAPRTGIAPSAHTGVADIRNLDIFTIPGVARLNNELDKESASVVDAQILWIVKNPAVPTTLYAIDANGSVYTSADSGDTWTEVSDRDGAGQGLLVWKDYLFVCEDTTIDVYGPLSGSPTWSDNWQTIDSDTVWHPMLISKNDGKIYGGAGRYIFSIEENSGQNFAPGTAATYTFTAQALDLPEDYRIKCLEELGNNLMIGTWQGTNIYDLKIADIFPWDRSATSFGQPVKIEENGVNALKTIGSYLYILAGIDGIIYKSNGVDAWPIAQIPQSIADLSNTKYLETYPGAIISFKGRLFFGLGVGGTGNIPGMGVWSLKETSQGTILTHEHTISTGSDGYDEVLKVSALLGITRDQIVVGWRDASTYGIDRTDVDAYATGYTGYFDSPLYRVGTHLRPRTFSQLEFVLAKELAANEGIRIQYRVNLTDSFTTIGTYTTANIGTGVISFNTTADIPACELLQSRVLLTGTTTSPEFKLVELK